MEISNLTQWISNTTQLFQPINVNKQFKIGKIYNCAKDSNSQQEIALVMLYDNDISLLGLFIKQYSNLYSADQGENYAFEDIKNDLEVNTDLCRICIYRRGDRLSPLLFIEQGQVLSNNMEATIMPTTTELDSIPEIKQWLSTWEAYDQSTFMSHIYSDDFFLNYFLSIEPVLEYMVLTCIDQLSQNSMSSFPQRQGKESKEKQKLKNDSTYLSSPETVTEAAESVTTSSFFKADKPSSSSSLSAPLTEVVSPPLKAEKILPSSSPYSIANKAKSPSFSSSSPSFLFRQQQLRKKSSSSLSSMDTNFETVYHLKSPLPKGRWTNTYAQELFNHANEDLMDGYIIPLLDTKKQNNDGENHHHYHHHHCRHHNNNNINMNNNSNDFEKVEPMEIGHIDTSHHQYPTLSIPSLDNRNMNQSNNDTWYSTFLQMHTSTSSNDYHRFLLLSNTRITKWVNDTQLTIED
ncbi:hypothetical protein BJ944DRAFT_249419 [Cunninghamella echinulata]|nr:hypothetical protein BJ944DRAFT_249419 [Cunninghamella echinulata]